MTQVTPPPAIGPTGAPQVTFNEASVRKVFLLFTIFWWIGYPLMFLIVGLPLLVTAIVFGCILLYWNWSLLQGVGARTTPGKAVGFCFIPFFCFYWWFVAHAGLATDNNRYMDAAGIAGPRISRGLAIAICVLGIAAVPLAFVPFASVVVAIPDMILSFIFAVQEKNVMLAILAHRQQAAVPAQTSAG